MNRLFIVFLLAGSPACAQSTAKLEFEAASVRTAPPAGNQPGRVFCNGGPNTSDPGLFTCQNMSLANLVTMAYSTDFYRLVAPDWMSGTSAWFNLSARVPPNTTKDQFDLMLQNLLTDRFKLSIHRENRETAQFDLVQGKSGPKFKAAAEPASATDNAGAPQPVTTDHNGFPTFQPGRAGMSTIRGKARMYDPRMTMQALAARLSGPLRSPVRDATGLTGQYEINLYWVMDSRPGAIAPPDGDPGPTLREALLDQLGLRLESKKGQAEFLVVDQAEKTPVEN
jgi:uncharacterized protein (TIGR03435 family)